MRSESKSATPSCHEAQKVGGADAPLPATKSGWPLRSPWSTARREHAGGSLIDIPRPPYKITCAIAYCVPGSPEHVPGSFFFPSGSFFSVSSFHPPPVARAAEPSGNPQHPAGFLVARIQVERDVLRFGQPDRQRRERVTDR